MGKTYREPAEDFLFLPYPLSQYCVPNSVYLDFMAMSLLKTKGTDIRSPPRYRNRDIVIEIVFEKESVSVEHFQRL